MLDLKMTLAKIYWTYTIFYHERSQHCHDIPRKSYSNLQKLGSGAFGAVFKAQCRLTHEWRAIKKLGPCKKWATEVVGM